MTHTNNNDVAKLLRAIRQDPEGLPRASFRTNARIRVLNTIAKPLAAMRPARMNRFWRGVVAAVATPAFLGVGTVLAAQTSKPNDLLYPVKIASENISLQLAPTSQLKTSVAIDIIRRRAEEIEHAESQNDTKELREAKATMTQTIDTLRNTSEIRQEDVDDYLENSIEIQRSPENPQTTKQEDRDESNEESEQLHVEGATTSSLPTNAPEENKSTDDSHDED